MKLAFDVYPPREVDVNLSPVILLHGRLDTRKTWTKIAPIIAEKTRRKVYAVDARNHGESPWSKEMDFVNLVSDLNQFMTDHGIPKAVLIGHSMGGRTAMIFVRQNPEKVEKLIVEDMTVEIYSTADKMPILELTTLLIKSLNFIPSGADEMTAKKCVYEYIQLNLPAGITKKVYDLETIPLKKTKDGYQWQSNMDVLEYTLKNNSPGTPSSRQIYDGDVLFLYGNKSFLDVEKDPMIPEIFPRAVKVCIEGASHYVHHDYPEEFIDEVLKFV